MIEAASVLLGCAGVGLALLFFLDGRRREKRQERIFALGVADNVGRMSGYFLAIEGETKYGEDDEEGGDEQVSDVMESLHTFYVRHGQEMKDILYQTRLYLPLWKSLSPQDRKMANETVDLFSWLVYEYYEPALPQSLRENRVFTSRDALNENRYAVARNAERIMQCA